MDVTQKIYTIIKERHIPVKAVCEGTNLPLKVMYSSLKENGKRKLRADEFLKICKFLKINPMSLREDKDENQQRGHRYGTTYQKRRKKPSQDNNLL